MAPGKIKHLPVSHTQRDPAKKPPSLFYKEKAEGTLCRTRDALSASGRLGLLDLLVGQSPSPLPKIQHLRVPGTAAGESGPERD